LNVHRCAPGVDKWHIRLLVSTFGATISDNAAATTPGANVAGCA
jgi:hypothetical protein